VIKRDYEVQLIPHNFLVFRSAGTRGIIADTEAFSGFFVKSQAHTHTLQPLSFPKPSTTSLAPFKSRSV
jgi:hypothetical protein